MALSRLPLLLALRIDTFGVDRCVKERIVCVKMARRKTKKNRKVDSYILVLAVPAVLVLEPGSLLALRRPLPLGSLPEEVARLRRVGEGVVRVDLAGESLIQWRHVGLFVPQEEWWTSQSINAKKRKKEKGGKSPQSVSNGWCNSISSVGKEKKKKKKSLRAVFRIHITYFLSLAGRRSHRCCSDAVSYIHTSSNLVQVDAQRNEWGGLQEDRIQQQQQQRASRLSLPPAVLERKVTAGTDTSAHKHQTAAARRSAHMNGSDIRRSAVGTHHDDFADGVRLKCFSVSFLSLPPFGSVRTEAPCGEQERPHVEGNTRTELTGRTLSLRCDTTLVTSDAHWI